MMDKATNENGEDGHALDELATQQARAELERVFAQYAIPGALQDELFCFGFADLVARIEILRSGSPTHVHAHLTLSGPALAVPVLDCWAAAGENRSEALANAVSQWAQGAYLAYHDAFAHDHAPTYIVEREGGAFHVFEAQMQWYGADTNLMTSV
jgi:hypothetical protein